MIRSIRINPDGFMYESDYCTSWSGRNVLTRNAIFDHFVEQIGGIGQKLVLAHALTCAWPLKVSDPMTGANAPVEMGSSTAVDYPIVNWLTKAGTENRQLFSEQTYQYTHTSTEQTCCNTTKVSSHSTAHEEVPQYQRIEHRLDPGVVPGVPVEVSHVGSRRPDSKGFRRHLSYVQPQIRESKIANQDLSWSTVDSNLQYRKSKQISKRMNEQNWGSRNYIKPLVNLDATITISTDVNSSQRNIFLAKTEKLGKVNNEFSAEGNCRRKFKQCLNGFFCCKCGNIEKTNGELRKQNYYSHQKCSRTKEFDKVQPTSEAAMVTLPSFYSKREWRYNTERWAIVSAFCHSIEQMCRTNNQKISTKIDQPKTRFYVAVTPDISVSNFLKRIGWFCDCPKECFVIALEYIHRTVKCNPEIQVNFNSVHHLILACLQVSVKFYDDTVLNQKYYAQVVGLSGVEISALEKELLFLLSFDLFVHPGRYQQILKQMLNDNKGLYKVDLRSKSM